MIGWKDLQVILTKAPIDKDGKSLAPAGLDIKTVRYFPLAQVLHAFDAGICATGYNGVHELLPAQVPTVFVSNIRGTDDQEAGAPEFKSLRTKGETHPIEAVGRELRKMFSWMKQSKGDDYKEGSAARG